MKRQYSKADIESTVETAEVRGLDHFLRQNPEEKIRQNRTETGYDNKEKDPITSRRSEQNSFFDSLMFGPTYHDMDDEKGTNEEALDTNETHTSYSTRDTHTSYSTESKQTYMEMDEELITCDPCEEVRDIVEGIRAGKYKLRSLVSSSEEMELTGERRRPKRRKRLRLPTHWRTAPTTNPRETAKRCSQQAETLYDEIVYWDNGNMQALKIYNQKG